MLSPGAPPAHYAAPIRPLEQARQGRLQICFVLCRRHAVYSYRAILARSLVRFARHSSLVIGDGEISLRTG